VDLKKKTEKEKQEKEINSQLANMSEDEKKRLQHEALKNVQKKLHEPENPKTLH